MTALRPVILSGGSGKRLWPVSTDALPKQFHNLVGPASLFEVTLKRVGSLAGVGRPVVATGAGHLQLVREALKNQPATILIEPGPRNTAAAVLAAARLVDSEDVVLVMPSDHLITDVEAFRAALDDAVELANQGALVTFGIVPDRAETGYGWIRLGAATGPGYEIDTFVEKPPVEVAEEMLAAGGHLWNSGMFIARAGDLLEIAAEVCPEVLDPVVEALDGQVENDGVVTLGDSFLDSPNIAFDRAVMERTTRGQVVPLEAGWDDVGSWDAIWKVSEKDSSGNVIEGKAALADTTNSLVIARSRDIAVVGLEDVVVVETEEGVLVASRESAQGLKEVVSRLKSDPA